MTDTLNGAITTDFMTSAANLLCGFNKTQILNVSNDIFTYNINMLRKKKFNNYFNK